MSVNRECSPDRPRARFDSGIQAFEVGHACCDAGFELHVVEMRSRAIFAFVMSRSAFAAVGTHERRARRLKGDIDELQVILYLNVRDTPGLVEIQQQ